MPELPEVEWMRRGAEAALGRTLQVVEARCPRLPALDGARGLVLRAVERRGKTLLLVLDAQRRVIAPRMTGRLLRGGEGARHPRLLLGFGDEDDLLWLVLDDPRRLATVELCAAAEAEALLPPRPEPWPTPLSGEALRAALGGGRGAIKVALLDPHRLRGVGNIGAAEGCWRAGLDPRRPVDSLGPAEWAALAEGLHAWASAALADIGAGPLVLLHGGGESPFCVYGRAGAPCLRCGALLSRSVDSGRSTFFCAGCQR